MQTCESQQVSDRMKNQNAKALLISLSISDSKGE